MDSTSGHFNNDILDSDSHWSVCYDVLQVTYWILVRMLLHITTAWWMCC